MLRPLIMLASLLCANMAARAQELPASLHAGDVHEIRIERLTSSRSSNESTSSSTDRDMFIERVVALREEGVELEYDLPGDVTEEDRARQWQLPARVLKPFNGPLLLLNTTELESRVDRWLAEAELPREACGHWIFTWNAFQIECDPQSVLEFVEALDLPRGLSDGAPYSDTNASGPTFMKRTASATGATFVAEMAVDPEAVRRGLAENDLVVAEIMRESLTPDAALQAHASDQISGTMTTTFETDGLGNVRRKTTVTKLEITDSEGVTETRTITHTVDRRILASGES